MIVVSDSTPLIHFAKIEHIEILFSLYKEVIITKEVYREVVEEGNILEKEDARIIQKYIGKSIKVKSPVSSPERLVEKYFIHKGEADSIQIAKEIDAHIILMNERDGRIAAKNEGILNKFRERPQIFWIEPNIIQSAIEKIYNNKL